MTLRGHIKEGAILFDVPTDLPGGAVVEVEVRQLPCTGVQLPTWGDVFRDLAGSVDGLPSDLAQNHDHYIHGLPPKAESRSPLQPSSILLPRWPF